MGKTGRGKGFGGGKGGQSKGGKDGWKAKGKGESKGKSKGKGYMGLCYDCGQQGHKRGEQACPWVSGGQMSVGAVEWGLAGGDEDTQEGGSTGVNAVELVRERMRMGPLHCGGG